MLSIGKLGQGQEAYYVETVAAGAEEYYVGAGEVPGRWTGVSAVRLGLSGEVGGADLTALLGHLDPATGEALTAGMSAPKVAGFDLTFCAPKSVSLLWAFGAREVADEVVAAHESSVAAAFAVMEDEAAQVRRGKAGRHVLDTDGLVAAAFRHRTSRAGDPHLHTHVVVANIGFLDEDGRWSALDARPLYRWAQAVGYLYEAHLRHELTRRLGVGWGPVRHGIADLAGTPRPAIDAFSTRRREILEHLDAHGVAGGRAAQVATYATRRAKGAVPATGDLRKRWAAHAGALGLDVAALGDPTAHNGHGAPAAAEAALFDELAGPAGVTRRRSTFDRRDVVKGVCDRMPAGAPVDQVVDLVDRFMLHPDVVPIGEPEVATRWTTRDLLACERRLLETASGARSAGRALVDTDVGGSVLCANASLDGEQRRMVTGLWSSGCGVEVVIGAAGAGKTSALAAAREGWDRAGYRAIGCALAARAAQQLADGARIPSTTVDRLLSTLGSGREHLDARSVVVVDEVGMVGTRQLEALIARADAAGAKVVLIGDPAQLPSIDAGGALAGLARRLGAHELSGNHRQVEAWEREALGELRAGSTANAVKAFELHGRVEASEDIDTVVERWWEERQRGGGVLLLASRRDQVRALNVRARDRLTADGQLGPDRWSAGGRRYAVGDEVVALRNDYDLGIINGDRGRVVGGDREHLRVQIGDARMVDVPLTYAADGDLDHGYALTIHKAQGLTADRTVILGDETLAREHAYVALSRARLASHLTIALAGTFDDRHGPSVDEPATPADRLQRIADRSAAQEMAIEL